MMKAKDLMDEPTRQSTHRGPPAEWCPWVSRRRRKLAWALELAGEAIGVAVAFALTAGVVIVVAVAVLGHVDAIAPIGVALAALAGPCS